MKKGKKTKSAVEPPFLCSVVFAKRNGFINSRKREQVIFVLFGTVCILGIGAASLLLLLSRRALSVRCSVIVYIGIQ